MSRRGWIGRPVDGAAGLALAMAVLGAVAPASTRGQEMNGSPEAPGIAYVSEAPRVQYPPLPPEVQVVRFQGPEGMIIEVLGPAPEPVPIVEGDEVGGLTVGLRVGAAYRLRLSELPNRPGEVLYPVVEVVGHLHRPPDIDPGRFPIRVAFGMEDVEDVVDRGRLVTQIVYLEDPDQAIPVEFPKDEVPIVPLDPAEEPLEVASALGRPMAIVRVGGRAPLGGEDPLAPLLALAPVPCPFSGPIGARCGLPCGSTRLDIPPGPPLLPRDEYLCDGGDHAAPLSFGPDGVVQGIDPRDALVRFDDTTRPRLLPTNTVCIYAPRFAAVRTSIGPNENLFVQALAGTERIEGQVTAASRQQLERVDQNRLAEAIRDRSRASGLTGKTFAGEHIEIRVLSGLDTVAGVASRNRLQGPLTTLNKVQSITDRLAHGAILIKTAEGPVVTGILESAGATVMSWKPQETAGVEEPPRKPGLAVYKQVSAGVAEQGETVEFTIRFRNMGNVPIRDVSIIDSLLPRLAYVEGSAQGPAGTVFTAADHQLGSTELRWVLPEPIAPDAEGTVSFQALVR